MNEDDLVFLCTFVEECINTKDTSNPNHGGIGFHHQSFIDLKSLLKKINLWREKRE